MKTLIIYDNTGYILLTYNDTYRKPQGGVQYLEVEIPTGKRVVSIDVIQTPSVPIYEDIPLTETELLKQKVAEQELAILELASLVGGTV
ncbi:hypothetical protein DIC82_14860 [Clostridium beijerinckii]|nr:hypothetical protein DIC82_14860 [Clostridium beijerinckii]